MFFHLRVKVLLLVFVLLLFSFSHVYAQSSCTTTDPCKDISDPIQKVSCYSSVVSACQSQKESMISQLVYLNSKIELTKANIEAGKLKIEQLAKQIEQLSDKIDNLETSLTQITSLFIDRIVATYKYGDVSYLNLLLVSPKFSDFVNRFKYFQMVQGHDRRLLFQLQNSKENFKEQKQQREEMKAKQAALQKQLEQDEIVLAQQKRDKEVFLQVTKNNEAVYKQNLAAAQKEAANIQKAASILSQAGVAKSVKKGDVIGLMGNTGFSTGAHLHFSVYDLKEADLNKFNFSSGTENPLNYLSSRSLPFDANACDDVLSRQTKSIGSGSWQWPMSNPTVSQCYGHTPFSFNYQSGIHNGVDMYDDNDILLKAVDDGNAYTYRGGQSAGNGVFIFHPNGKMTLYWHLQ